MTVEVFEPTSIYTIQGIGPYAISHPYTDGAIRVSVIHDGQMTALQELDFTLAPTQAEIEGDLFLAEGVAAIYANAKLVIERETVDEQGWRGILGERERGLEVQLDRIVMAVQELRRQARLSLRSLYPMNPIVPEDGRVLRFLGDDIVAGPLVIDVENAAEYAAEVRQGVEEVRVVAQQLPALPRSFDTASQLIAALPGLAQGIRIILAGQPCVIDSTAIGMDSALWTRGIDGVRALGLPQNAYIAAFHDHNSPRVIRLYSSSDSLTWRLLNALPLEYDGANAINGGNPVLAFWDGWFYLMVSFTSVGNYDFRIYKTRDFTSFIGPFNCNLGPTPISSNTNPAPGGTVPANEVWGAEMVFTPEGEMHVFASIPYGPDITDIRGRTIGNRRTYRAKCNNLQSLTFDAPQIVLPAGNNWSMIDASATRTPNGWLLNIKDSTKQTIRVYTGSNIEGPWTFQEEVANADYAIEGSSIVPRRRGDGNITWDMFVEGHNTLPDWISAQQIMVYRGGTTPAGWGAVAPTWLKSTRGIRHGTPLNLGFQDPAAYQAVQRFALFSAGGAVENNEQWNELMAGSRSIVPNPGAVYFVTGDTVTNLTILNSSAEEFFLAVLSTNVAAGINIVDNGRVVGAVTIGFGRDSNRLVRFIRREDTGRYHAESGAGKPTFAANKDGNTQTIGSSFAQITFPNEVIDAGGHFAGNGWTPPAGRYLIQASVSFTGATTDQTNTFELRRNGTSIRRVLGRSTAGPNCLSLSAIATGNGTDVFTLHLEAPGAGDKVISGSPDVTWFEGAPT